MILVAALAMFSQVHGQSAAAGSSDAAAFDSKDFPLGPRDKLRLRVGQWEPTEGVYKSWPEFGGEYLVGSTGLLSLPLIGAVNAAGRSPEVVAGEISSELYARVGLVEPPSVSIEVVEYRPVYIIGAVREPGRFPFVPGLSVLQAVGLAGGVEAEAPKYWDGPRNAVGALGEYEVLRLELWRNLAQRARLEAELGDQEAIELPIALAEAPIAAELMEMQREIKRANERALQSSLAQFKSLEELLERQISQLEARLRLRDEQVELARQEMAGVDQLVDKGLSVTSRKMGLARIVADLESGLLEIETAKLEAEQQLAEAKRDQLDLVNDRRLDLLALLEETRSHVVAIEKKMETAKALFAVASQNQRLDAMTSIGEPVFTVTRRTENGFETIVAEGGRALLPEDVLEVEIPLLDGLLAPSR